MKLTPEKTERSKKSEQSTDTVNIGQKKHDEDIQNTHTKNKRENTVYLFLLWVLVRANKASTIDGRNLVDPSTLPLLTCLYWHSVNLWIIFFLFFSFINWYLFCFKRSEPLNLMCTFNVFLFDTVITLCDRITDYHIHLYVHVRQKKNPKQVSMIMDIQSNLP